MTTIPSFSALATWLIATAPFLSSCAATCPPGTIRNGDRCIQSASNDAAGPSQVNTSEQPQAAMDASEPFAGSPGRAGAKRGAAAGRNTAASGTGNSGTSPSAASGDADSETAGHIAEPVAGTNSSPAGAAGSGGSRDDGGTKPPSTSMLDSGVSSEPKTPKCGNRIPEMGETCDGDCPDTCPATSMCLQNELVGSAAACTAKCEAHEITDCKDSDNCCPRGCTSAQDNDCPKRCGDGTVDPPELCEPTSATHPCPTSCDDGDPCTNDFTMGSPSQCTAACAYSARSPSGSNQDSCCPDGANSLNDADCDPKCGNGVLERGEVCDGDCPTSCPATGDACMVAKLEGNGCSRRCSVSTLRPSLSEHDGCCPSGGNATNDVDCKPVCGNGVIEDGEKCDGNCPTTCPGGSDPCVIAEVTPTSGCNRQCSQRLRPPSGTTIDHCCPKGADPRVDDDCAAKCGNQVVDKTFDEVCDNSSTTDTGTTWCNPFMTSPATCNGKESCWPTDTRFSHECMYMFSDGAICVVYAGCQ